MKICFLEFRFIVWRNRNRYSTIGYFTIKNIIQHIRVIQFYFSFLWNLLSFQTQLQYIAINWEQKKIFNYKNNHRSSKDFMHIVCFVMQASLGFVSILSWISVVWWKITVIRKRRILHRCDTKIMKKALVSH